MPLLSEVEILINAGSGSKNKEEETRLISDVFKSNGIKAHFLLARNGPELLKLAERSARGKTETIIAGGGDGTVSTVAAAILGTSKRLGVLPLGTLNHFAKDMHIPLDIESATRNIISGQSVTVDVGSVNKRIFVNNSSLGLYPNVVHNREKQQRLGLGKWPAFLWATLRALVRYPLLSVRFNVDGTETISRTPFVFIGNNEYKMDLFNIGSRESLKRGQLSLYIAPLTGRAGLVGLGLKAFIGRLSDGKNFKALLAQELWVEPSQKSIRVAIDGEVSVMETPLHYLIHPKALHVIVPREAVKNPQESP